MKSILAFFAVAAVFYSLDARPMPDAEAVKYLKKLAQSSKNYQRRADKTYFFSRAQLKYGLERNDYLRRWCDRPLMQDSSYSQSGTFERSYSGTYSSKGFINPKTFAVESALLKKFNFAGFAFFPETSGRVNIYDHVGQPYAAPIILMPEYAGGANLRDLDRRMVLAEQALKSPHTFRINGKVVITSYPASADSRPWAALKKRLIEKFGDKFILMPWTVISHDLKPSGKDGKYSVADIKKMEENLRTILRNVDGFYHNAPPFQNRRYHWEFDREVLIPIIHSVMSEPEFKNKYLGWGTKVGHMNCHSQPYAVDAYGTNTLRGTVGAAVIAKADFVNCVEWDEENENTCFRPITTTGFSTLRICRAFEQIANNKPFTVLPGDNTALPNLVLSYSRVMAAGQLMEFEVAAIPDGTGKKSTVKLELADNDGKIVHQFPEFSIDFKDVNAKVLTLSSEKLLKYRFLNPVLTVNGQRFDRGFYPIELRTWWHWDYLWAKHVLRDMPFDTTASIKLGETRKDGFIEAEVKVKSTRPLRSVEIISGDNLVVYSHSPAGSPYRSDDKVAGFRFSMQSVSKSDIMLNGKIKILNAPNCVPSPMRGRIVWKKNHWKVSDQPLQGSPLHRFFQMPREEAEQAVMEIDLPGFVENAKIRLADVLKYGSIGIAGRYSSNFVVAANSFQDRMPEVLGGKEYNFKVLLRPDMPDAGYFVQTVDDKFQLFRSRKITNFKPTGVMKKFNVYSVGSKCTVSAEADAGYLQSVEYDFSGHRGSVFPCLAGSRWDGILNGQVPLTTGFGQGESSYGTAMAKYFARFPEKAKKTTPERVIEDNKPALKFNGGQFVSLPLAMIPAYSGFIVEMEVFTGPKGVPMQSLLTDSMMAFRLFLRNGVPGATIYRNQFAEAGGTPAIAECSGPRLQPWQWNNIKVVFDQKHFTVYVNDVPGKPVKANGYHRYPRATVMGASERGEFFTGMIRKLKISAL